ncbi:MAG: BCCT family transporter, partial [Candidatus Adiutrix sp.]
MRLLISRRDFAPSEIKHRKNIFCEVQMLKHEANDFRVNYFVVFLSIAVFGFLIVMGAVSPDKFIDTLKGIVNTLCDWFGWGLNWAIIFCIVVSLYFLFSKNGDIVIGGDDAKPEFTWFSWWAISLCSGMGMGIVFFPPAEIIEYTFRPAVGSGLEPG